MHSPRNSRAQGAKKLRRKGSKTVVDPGHLRILDQIAAEEWDAVLEADELVKSQRQGAMLIGWLSPLPRFPPTYKVS
jgi:hypothetical protein